MSATAMYKALLEAKVDPDTAERAVKGMRTSEEVATKTDLANLELRITKWMIALHAAALGLIIAAMKFL